MAVGERDLSRSRAVLIGNGTFRPDSGIPGLPAAGAGVAAMAELLTSGLCGWPPDRVEILADVATGGELARRLTQAVADVTDVLVVYYAGRGLRTGQGELALALADSDAAPGLVSHTAMRYRDFAGILNCRAASKLVFLDCEGAESAAGYPVDGMYLVGVGTPAAGSAAPSGPLTPFTAALVEAVRAGDPAGPPVLTLDQIVPRVRDRILRDGLPMPVELGRGVPQYAFAYNAATMAAAAPAAAAQPPTELNTPSGQPGGAPPLIPGWMSGGAALENAATQTAGDPSAFAPPAQAPQPAQRPVLTRRRLLIGAGAAVVVAGGGAAAGVLLSSNGSGRTPTPPAPTVLAGRLRWTSAAFGPGSPGTPVVSNGTVFVSSFSQSSDGTATGNANVYALDAATGAKTWTAPVAGALAGVTDAVVAGSLVLASSFIGGSTTTENAVLYAFDRATGRQRWTFNGTSSTLGRPIVVNGMVYVSDSDLTGTVVYGLKLATGATVWTQKFPSVSIGTLTADAGGVYLASSGDLTASVVYGIDPATGDQRWTSPGLGDTFLSRVTIAGSAVYVGSETAADTTKSSAYALDAATGRIRWTSAPLNAAVSGDPVIVGDTVYLTDFVSATSGYLYALNAATGETRWQLAEASVNGISVVGGVVYVGVGPSGGGGALYALDPATGRRRWSSPLAGNGAGDVDPQGAAVYVTDYNQNASGFGTGGCAVYAVNSATGARLWRLPLPGDSLVGEVVSGGTLYVTGGGSGSGYASLYAIG